MESVDLISKKDLLQQTGISYGQLYRWKRQKLIPDAWFMKRSSFTGQETFLPKDKVLQRVYLILKLKDRYSLEEMAALFSPEHVNRTFPLEDVADGLGLSDALCERCRGIWGRLHFSFSELLLIEITQGLQKNGHVMNEEIAQWLVTAKHWTESVQIAEYRLVVARKQVVPMFFLQSADGKLHMDNQTDILAVIDLSENARRLNMKLQHIMEG